jgi:hypothetical protein
MKSAENRRVVRRNATMSRSKNETREKKPRPGHKRNTNEADEELCLDGMIGSRGSDPFRAFPVEMETYMYQLFDYSKK